MKQRWTRTEIIGLATLAVTILGVVVALSVAPGFREWFVPKPRINNENLSDVNGSDAGQTKKSEGYGRLFDQQDPYPIGFGRVKVGNRVSVLQVVYPEGKLDSFSYDVRVTEGPFDFVLFHHHGREDDPAITSISFHFRDDAAEKYAREQAVSVFGADQLKSIARGSVLEWPNINGYRVTIRDTYYSVSKLETSE